MRSHVVFFVSPDVGQNHESLPHCLNHAQPMTDRSYLDSTKRTVPAAIFPWLLCICALLAAAKVPPLLQIIIRLNTTHFSHSAAPSSRPRCASDEDAKIRGSSNARPSCKDAERVIEAAVLKAKSGERKGNPDVYYLKKSPFSPAERSFVGCWNAQSQWHRYCRESPAGGCIRRQERPSGEVTHSVHRTESMRTTSICCWHRNQMVDRCFESNSTTVLMKKRTASHTIRLSSPCFNPPPSRCSTSRRKQPTTQMRFVERSAKLL
jgi:hypothetical protein